MNVFIGAANNVNAITTKTTYDSVITLECLDKIDLMLHADFAYAFDERKGMWIWIKCIYNSLIKYEYFSERDIQEIIAYYAGCSINNLRKVIPLENTSVKQLVSDFKQNKRAKIDERL